ncbi:isopenicillin N synthase family dioxygenase [Pseudonocardia sp. TRM90224]|uniref:isopenicillin N synthase family dioxygenase n=1 Tax=Pseudonocardia sp. TRM90224 TaxID=2812678 RepID=UPI001E3BE626|nr:2-oxoglutarate and iron-dependent oxygenase domain-containing protein [Pseudonocardia sp. TRM90224]
MPSEQPRSLPTVDVSPFATGAAPSAAQDEVAAELDRICREIGFFLISGHGVEPAVKDDMMEAMRRFFALPEAEKLELAIDRSPCHRGYVAIASETLDDAKKTAGDLKESLDTGGEHGPDHPEVVAGTPLFGPNQFPADPGFRAAWDAYRAQVIEAAQRVQRAMARALGMHDEFLLDREGGEVMYHLRHLHYPPQDTVVPGPDQLGCGAHTDYGSLTLLADDGIGGLQVMRRDGVWMDVAVPSDRLVVNLGDLMAIWTNDRWVSNPHRVVNPPHSDRYSMPLFVHPPYHAQITCLPTCLEPGEEPRYEPQGAGDYLMMRLDATHSYRNPLLAG